MKLIYKKYHQLLEKNRSLQKQVIHLKSKKYVVQASTNLLTKQRNFTKAEAKYILSGKSPRKLQPEDVATGLVVKSMSPKTYNYLRRKKKVYLPAKTTLCRAKSKYNIRFGYQGHLLRYIFLDFSFYHLRFC